MKASKPRIATLSPAVRMATVPATARPLVRIAPDRIRGGRLQRIRADWFGRFPLCVHCQAKDPPRVRLATELDHIVPLFQGGPDFDRDNERNRQGLCAECHAAKTVADLGPGAAVGGLNLESYQTPALPHSQRTVRP